MNKVTRISSYRIIFIVAAILGGTCFAKEPDVCYESRQAKFGVLVFGELIDFSGEYYVRPSDRLNFGADITIAKPRANLVRENCEGLTRGFLHFGRYENFANSNFSKNTWKNYLVTKEIDGVEYQRKRVIEQGISYTELLLKKDEYFVLIIDIDDNQVNHLAGILQKVMAAVSKPSFTETRDTIMEKLKELKERK